MAQRLSRAGMIAAGIVLIAVAFGYLMFWRTAPFEALTADFRPLMTAETVARLQNDTDGLEAAANEYRTALIPAIAARSGTTVTQIETAFARQYPAVTSGMEQIPQIATGLRSLAATFDSERARFRQADAIPTQGLTTTLIPWLLTGAALLAFMVARSAARSRNGASIAIILGAALVAVPLIISMPSKAAAADRLNANLEAVFTAGRVAQTEQAVDTLQAMTSEIMTVMLPEVSAELDLPPEQVTTFLAQNFPALTATLQTAPESLARAQAIADVYADNLSRYEDIKPVSFRVITWSSIGAGLLLMVAGAAALAGASRPAAILLRERRPARGRKTQAA